MARWRRSLDQCRVLITGASRGIGRQLACEFARLHARLLVVARDVPLLESLGKELQELGATSVDSVGGDLTQESVRRAAIERVADRWNSLDVLANNAGVSAHGLFASHDEETLRQIMEVNFYAATELTRLALPLLQSGQDPAIVNIGSILGHRGLPHNSEYSASKFALRGWSEALRAELHGRGIDVLLVSPGTTDTEFFEHLLTKTETPPWGVQKGIAPAAVAKQIIRALQTHKSEIYPNWRGRMLVALNRWAPRLVDRIVSRYGGTH